MNPSHSTISDALIELHHEAIEIDACLLIGEKVSLIHEAAITYNAIRALVTPEYFMQDEFDWIKDLGHGWNAEVQQYRKSMGNSLEDGHRDNLDELENQIRDALDDLMGPRFDEDDLC